MTHHIQVRNGQITDRLDLNPSVSPGEFFDTEANLEANGYRRETSFRLAKFQLWIRDASEGDWPRFFLLLDGEERPLGAATAYTLRDFAMLTNELNGLFSLMRHDGQK